MADDIRTPVLKSLGESDYYGMDPAQMLQVAENERANDTLNYNMAKSLSDQQERAKQLAIDHMQTKRDMQFKQFKEQFDQKAKIADLELSRRRLDINAKMADATAAKNDLLSKKLQMEITKLDEAKVQFDKIKNVMVRPKGTNVDVPLGSLMGAANMGYNIPLSDNNSSMDNLYKDTKTGKYLIMYKDGSTKDVNQLKGKDLTSVGKGGVNINLGMDELQAKAEATATGTAKGKMTAKLLSPEAWDESIKSLEAADPLFMGNKIADPVGTNVKVINHMLQRASAIPSAKGKTLQYIPGRGVFEVFPDKKGGFKKDASGDLVLGKQFTMPSSLE